MTSPGEIPVHTDTQQTPLKAFCLTQVEVDQLNAEFGVYTPYK